MISFVMLVMKVSNLNGNLTNSAKNGVAQRPLVTRKFLSNCIKAQAVTEQQSRSSAQLPFIISNDI